MKRRSISTGYIIDRKFLPTHAHRAVRRYLLHIGSLEAGLSRFAAVGVRHGMVLPVTLAFLLVTCGAPDQMAVLFLGLPPRSNP